MHKIFIDGQAGTTGLRIHQYLANRPEFELLEIAPEARKNVSAKHDLIGEADVVILCLPDDAARETVKLAANARARILDASTAHRVDEAWVYGLPELEAGQRDRIRTARLVSNPGCYSTGFLLLVRPLIDAGLIDPATTLTISALSGYTGGGRAMVERYEARAAAHPEALWPPRPYALDMSHKHLPEMTRYAGLQSAPLFLPSVGHFPQGMLVSVPLAFDWTPPDTTLDTLVSVLREAYAGEPCITVYGPNDPGELEEGQLSPTAAVDTNRVDLFVFGNERQAVLVARLDNLGKGAGGAAVQNLNIMLGLDELEGLSLDA